MKRKKKSLPSFIDNERYFLKYGTYKKGNEVIYKRLSDDEMSIGTIKWFEYSKKEDRVIITVIDSTFQNFQSGYLDEVVEDLPKKQLDKIKKKKA